MNTNLFRDLGEYEVDCLNETPPRREDVVEVGDRESATHLCYANPDHAEALISAVNAVRYFDEDHTPLEIIGQVHAVLAAVKLKLTERDIEDTGIDELLRLLGKNPC